MSLQAFGLARIGRDAEIRYTPDGTATTNLSLAFNVFVKGQKSTQWIDGTLWAKRAETLAPYLLKGTAVAVTLDEVHIEDYTNRDGSPGHKLVGRVSSIDLAGGGERTQAPAPAPTRAPPARTQAPAPPPQRAATSFDDMPDDILF